MATADQRRATAAKRNGNGQATPPKAVLNELGEKIFLDRYALKDMTKRSLAVGDTVIVCVNQKTRQREIGTVRSIANGRVSIELRDGMLTEQGIEAVDKPLETTPDQMMERVARGIAAIETVTEKQREWEANFRWLLDDWKFVPGGRILTAAGTDQQLTFYNCMPPDQEILTAQGYKPIAEVGVGDLVVTHRNRLRQVLHKFERETEEPIYIFKTKKLGYDDLRVTGEHKVLAIRSEWLNKHKSRDGLRLKQEAQWIPAKELKPGDFLAAAYNGEEAQVAPIYLSEYIAGYDQRNGKLFKSQQRSDYHGHLTAGGTRYDVHDRLVIDADLCYLFGRWLGDGNVNHRTKTDIPSGIKIVFGLDEREEAEQIAQIIENKFGVPTSLKLSSTERWLDLWTNSMALGQFFKAFFGCYSYGKQIPAQLLQLPHDLTLALLKGLFTADGYVSDNKLGILLSNRVLATQVHQLLLRLGFLFSIKENTHRLGRRPAYRIQATANECGVLFKDFFGAAAPSSDIDLKYYFEHDGLRWVRIDEIAVEDYTGIVLDIEVEEDHSFVSAGVVVSNCYVVPSPHDSRRGIVDTLSQMMEIMSRGGGVGINISTLRPSHAYVKGVNGRSSGSVSWGGLYSFVTGLIEQGGCLTPDTLVFTENGLLRLDEINEHPEPGWREQNLVVMTDEGERLSRQVFNNGTADVLTVNTNMGLTITGTPNHKVKVMTKTGPQWRRLDELQRNDAILVKLGQHTGKLQRLQKPDRHHHNQDMVDLPQVLDEELAFFLGYMAGNGFMTVKEGDWRLGVAVAHDSYLIDEMPTLMKRLFKGVNVRVQQKAHDASLIYLISNRTVKEFLRINGFDKGRSADVCVPRLIRQSPPQVVAAFLRGLFEADGSPSHGYPSLMSTSKRLIDEAATLLIGLGCPVKIGQQPGSTDRYGTQTCWSLRIHSFLGLANWQAMIGCDSRSRFASCLDFVPDLHREVSYILPHTEYWVEPVLSATTLPQIDHRATGQRIKSTDTLLRRKLLRYSRGERNLTFSAYTTLSESHPAFAEHAPAVDDLWFVSVESVQQAGQSLTLDLEVDDNHTYLANGLVTHNSRRGALMLILNVWHPDVLDFINAKREMGRITNANISVGITDAFMEAVQADADWELVFPDPQHPDYDTQWKGDIETWRAAGRSVVVHKTVKARAIWNNIIESAWASAEPGVWFIDRANKMSNSWYFSPLICTNPCTTGDTLVATEQGYIRARDLKVGMKIRTPAGLKPIEKVYNNGIQRIYRIEFSDGGFLECTADHKLKVVRDKKYEWIATSDLRQGDKVLVAANESFGPRFTLPAEAVTYVRKRGLNVADYYDQRLGFLVGVTIGDGVLKKVRAGNSHPYQCVIAFGAHEEAWEDHFVNVMNEMNIHTHRTVDEKEFPVGDGTVVLHRAVRRHCYKLATLLTKLGLATNIKGPQKVIPEPFMGMEKEFLAGILDGLFSTDGSVLLKQDNPMLRFHTSSYELAQQVRLILLQFGIHGRIYRSTRDEDLEYEGRSMYGTGEKYDVIIMNEGIARFYAEIGLSHPEKAARLKDVAENWHFIGGTWTASIVSIQDTEREEEVFDVYEPHTLTWVTNGYVSFDCGEQPLPAFGICNLGALNLSRFAYDGEVLWDDLRQAVRYAVRFLDNVIDSTPYFFEENKAQQQSERRVGLGIMGLADMLIRLRIRYGSEECIKFLDQLGEVIATEAYLASADNAAEKGVFPMFDADKLLQSGYMQAMPEQVRQTIREQGLRNVTLLTVAPTGTTGTMVATSTGVEPYFSWSYFRKSRLGIHEERVAVVEEWEREHPGQPLPDYFINAMQLSPTEHVKVQGALQRWIDSAISKTCNVPNEYTVEQTRELYEYMYRLGCKGGTIYRDGSRDEQVLNLKKEEEKKPEAQAAVEKPKQKAAELWSQPKIRPRPKRSRGVTVQKESPLGSVFVTVNDDDDGEPLEVFVTAGKAGSDVTSMAEALGRLASLVLRVASPLTPRERLNQIAHQLKGIGGARTMGFGKDRVRSLPDAVAQAIEECCTPNDGVVSDESMEAAVSDKPVQVQLTLPSIRADLCPSCGEAAFVHEEGCMHCNACGFSQC
jgi:ribonucleoside-diphosphate reductase alpha chain